MTQEDLHVLIRDAHTRLASAIQPAVNDPAMRLSSDTWFAIGEMMGVMAKAKALVGRDIDDRVARRPTTAAAAPPPAAPLP